jgi:hypothetical protein
MSKPTDVKKPSVVVAIGAPQVPALPKSPSLWKEFRRWRMPTRSAAGTTN